MMTLTPPGERRIYRVRESVFRVWMDRPEACAEFFKAGEWVWTPIPSGSIIEHPLAQELSPKETQVLRLPN